MTAAEAIDTIIAYTTNTDGADPDAALRRLRVLNYLQDTLDEVWLSREWAFTYIEAAVTLDAQGVGVLPVDYLEMGVQGGLYDAVGETILEVPYTVIRKAVLQGNTSGIPECFAIISNGALLEIRTPLLGSSYDVNLHYRRLPPTLADDTTVLPIPLAHHNPVLVAGAAAKQAYSLGDRAPTYEQSFQMGLNRMISTERSRKTSIQKMPRSVSMW